MTGSSFTSLFGASLGGLATQPDAPGTHEARDMPDGIVAFAASASLVPLMGGEMSDNSGGALDTGAVSGGFFGWTSTGSAPDAGSAPRLTASMGPGLTTRGPVLREDEDGGDAMPFIDLNQVDLRKIGFNDWGWFGGGPGQGPGGGSGGSGFIDWDWFGGGTTPGSPVPKPPPEAPLEPPVFLPDISGFSGANQTIVIIDDGFSDLYDQSNIVFGTDFFDDDDDAEVTKLDSHGAQVEQIAVQIAADVEVIHLKVFGDTGLFAPFDVIEESLQWVVDNSADYNIAAVNLSLGGGNVLEETESQLSDEFQQISDLGIFNIVASGNDGFIFEEGVNAIAADPNAIAVSATDDRDRFTGFSQNSPTLTDIAAPGDNLPVETLDGTVIGVTGTSFSAPLVTGIAALLQEASEIVNGERLDEFEFLEILRESGRDIVGASDGVPGYRIADPKAAVEYFLANSDQYDDPGPTSFTDDSLEFAGLL